jgi:4-hydroxy-2-oxovalerate aldolase
VILDCTIRDGSYAVDFKFTAADTALIVGLLDAVGIPYVEIGHGLGLGASEAGKGRAPSRDADVIAASRARATRARIGAFYIPGIGTEDDLARAADAGLDFVRVGNDADRMEAAWPAVARARDLGLEVFVNLMKTYGIAPEAFGEVAREAAARGAAGIYVVDSAGGMLPAEVAAYTEAALAAAPGLAVGFHGHSNLHLAVANALAAIEAGATFVDTSVYGIGRSSGNVPTEVLAVLLARMGIDVGVDPHAVMELAGSYLAPLAADQNPHDMVAVALGFGRFHSSFLDRAFAAASEAGISPLRLIVALGERDVLHLTDAMLADAVEALRDQAPPPARTELVAFADPRFGPRRIGNRPEAVAELVEALGVVAAKRRLAVVLDLQVSAALDEDEVTAEHLGDDADMALGRLRGGTPEALGAALAPHREAITLLLADTDSDTAAAVPDAALLPYSSGALTAAWLGDVAAASGAATIDLLDPGFLPPAAVEALRARLAAGATVRVAGAAPPDDPAQLTVVAGPSSAVALPDARPVVAADDPFAPYLGRLRGWQAALAAARHLPTAPVS